MIKVNIRDIKEPDILDRPVIPYGVAKRHGIKKGTIFQTDAGKLKAVEYMNWNSRTNQHISGFACEEVK